MSFYNEDDLKKAQAKVRENASKSQLQMLNVADEAFQQVADDLDKRLVTENKLRQWAEALCGVRLGFSEIEELRNVCQSKPAGAMFQFSAARGPSAILCKTAFGTVDRVDNYLKTLERTVVDITNNSQFTPLSPLGLIKLAIKRLFKRSK